MEVTWRSVTMIGARETALIRSRCPDCNPNHSTGWGGGWRNMDTTRALWTSIAASFGNLEVGGLGEKKTIHVMCVHVFVHVCILLSGWLCIASRPDFFFPGRCGSCIMCMHAQYCVLEKWMKLRPTRGQSSFTVLDNYRVSLNRCRTIRTFKRNKCHP